MSYPQNRRERFLIGKRKGEKRSYLYWGGYASWFDLPDFFFKKSPRAIMSIEDCKKLKYLEKSKQLRRNTTKLCSCWMCGNPRKYLKELALQERKQGEKFKYGYSRVF